MTLLQALLLGFIQGFTEFLPISSSGHLVIAQYWLGYRDPLLVMDTVLHLGTLMAVLIFFFPTFKKLTRHTVLVTFLGTIPAVIAGVFISAYAEPIFSSLIVVGFGLLVTATLLLMSKYLPVGFTKFAQISFKQAVFIGLVQAIAIIPGISRSGSTIVAGLGAGLTSAAAFTYSFYLAIPAIGGAFILQLPKIVKLSPADYLPLIVGFAAAVLGGLISINILKYVLTSKKLYYFGYYCLAVGAITLLYAL
jgi:undecaprenyl-diphosphatase